MVFFLLIIKTTAINLEIINGDRQPCDFGSAMYLSVIYIYCCGLWPRNYGNGDSEPIWHGVSNF